MKHAPAVLRYWLCTDIPRDRIRVEWTDRAGTTRTSEGLLDAGRGGYQTIRWLYDVPPANLAELALDCMIDNNEYGVDGAEFRGYETGAQMDAAVGLAFEHQEAA